MSTVDFIAVLQKIKEKAGSSTTQQMVDYIDGQIDLLKSMNGIETASISISPTQCDPKIFIDALGESASAVAPNPSIKSNGIYTNTQGPTVSPMYTQQPRFHGAEFTADDL